MGRDGSRRRDKTKHQVHHQESEREHALEVQRREREDIVGNFGIDGSKGAGRFIVGAVIVVFAVAAIISLLALITFR